jgi:hypothetical protein
MGGKILLFFPLKNKRLEGQLNKQIIPLIFKLLKKETVHHWVVTFSYNN